MDYWPGRTKGNYINKAEWIEAKRGKISASNAHRLMGSRKTLEKYAKQLVAQTNGEEVILSGLKYGDLGLIHQGKIIKKYSDRPSKYHLITHPEYDFVVCSPDHILDGFTGLEVKCKFDTPNSRSWGLIKRKPTKNDALQCQFSLWCSDFDKWILAYAHIQEHIELLEYEIYPDESIHQIFDDRVRQCKDLMQSIQLELA